MNRCQDCGCFTPTAWSLVIHKLRGCDYVVPVPEEDTEEEP